jgi:2-polyprenyl-6-methoxyphenol hydroxylase-like FAD-dependent oxidoreductase
MSGPGPTGRVQCAIAGAGPAGAMLAFMLARQGIEVLLLEKHADFLRDFRGDTIHPSTMEILEHLGLADELLALEHHKVDVLRVRTPDGLRVAGDLRRLRSPFPYIVFVPQWDFLDMVTDAARRYPAFRLEMRAEARELIEAGGRVCGLRYETPDGPKEVRASLVVAADGRDSTVREAARLRPVGHAPPMDVLWFRISREAGDPEGAFGQFTPGHLLAFINRRSYWQIAYLVPKGSDARVRAAGLEAFRRSVAELVPELAGRVDEIRSWDDVKLLSVQVNRLRRWYRPGLLCIGDAAHAMSPVGGVGINLAIQDAVTAANVLGPALRRGRVSSWTLARVQARREIPTRVVQRLQVVVQGQLIVPTLGRRPSRLAALLARLVRLPGVSARLPRLGGRLIGLGIMRSRVKTAAGVDSPPTTATTG